MDLLLLYILISIIFTIKLIWDHTKVFDLYISDAFLSLFRGIFWPLVVVSLIFDIIDGKILHFQEHPIIKKRS